MATLPPAESLVKPASVRHHPAASKTTGARQIVLPRSTPVPNFFFDRVMPGCNHADWKVLCFIWRKTVGWDKDRDFVSLAQIESGAGVCRDVAIAAVRHFERLGLIRRTKRAGIRGTNEYEAILNHDEGELTRRLGPPVKEIDPSLESASTSRFIRPPLVEKIDTRKAPDQKALSKKANRGFARLRSNGDGMSGRKTGRSNGETNRDEPSKFASIPVG